MEESKQVTVSPQPTPAGTFNLKIENTTYVVGVHFSKTAKDTLEDKMKRLMLDDVKTANFEAKIRKIFPLNILTKSSPKAPRFWRWATPF